MRDFEDKVVLVTGAGRGIGRAAALAFAAQGAIVAANDISPMGVEATVDQIVQSGGRAKAYVFDVAKRMPVQAMIDEILTDYERLDIVINNAAVAPRASILDMDEWDWHRVVDVNLGGPFFTMQHAGRAMRQQGSGVIINIADSAGRTGGIAGRSAYLASKAGLIGLSREAAREFAAYGIRVNALCPGIIASGPAVSPELEAAIPQGKAGSLENVVSVILFMCSPAAEYIVGQALHVDGGMVML